MGLSEARGLVLFQVIRGVPGLLSSCAGQRHQANHGAPDARAQDGSDYVNSLEEGRELRRRKTEIASRLSVSGEGPFHLR